MRPQLAMGAALAAGRRDLIAAGAAVVAALSGDDLAETRGLDALPEVQTHQERGVLLRNILLGFTVVVGLGAWRLGGPSGLKSGRGERPPRPGSSRSS